MVVAHNNLEMLQWLLENGCPWEPRVEALLHSSKLEITAWLWSNNYLNWDSRIRKFTDKQRAKVLDRMRKLGGCPWDEKAMMENSDRAQMYLYLYSLYVPYLTHVKIKELFL